MPIKIEEFNSLEEREVNLSENSTQRQILRFLFNNRGLGYLVGELADELDEDVGDIRKGVVVLFEEGLLQSSNEYWAIEKIETLKSYAEKEDIDIHAILKNVE